MSAKVPRDVGLDVIISQRDVPLGPGTKKLKDVRYDEVFRIDANGNACRLVLMPSRIKDGYVQVLVRAKKYPDYKFWMDWDTPVEICGNVFGEEELPATFKGSP
jgi:hypothetical protein